MKVSIVMLAYNHERFIEKALNGVLLQDISCDYELIIGEDHSTDGTRSVIEAYRNKFGSRLKPLYRKRNRGMVRNMLDCLEHCTGEYIAFLEGDDFWTDPLKLKKQVQFLEEHPEYVAAAHNWNIVSVKEDFIKKGFENETVQEYQIDDLGKFSLPAQTSTLMMRNIYQDIKKKYLKKIIWYLWIPMDRIAAFLFTHSGKVIIFPETMSCYRYYIEENGSNWSSKYEIEAKQNYLYFFAVALGMESMAKRFHCPLDLTETKLRLFKESRQARKWSKRKRWLWLQGIIMLVLEPHRIRFIKKIKSRQRFG